MRTSIATLNRIAARINIATQSPINASFVEDNNLQHSIGHYMVESGSKTYGRAWKLVRIGNAIGGQTTILCGHTAALLEYQMRAWLDGYQAAK